MVLLARGDGNAPIQILLPTPEATTGQSALRGGLNPILPREEDNLKVDIRGAVRNPGVYDLPPGSRLGDAVAAAGGVTDEADIKVMRLSLRVRDEGYYYIISIGETPRPAIAAALASMPTGGSGPIGDSSGSGPGSSSAIDLNTATAGLLESLPGIGEVRAKAIVDHRRQNGCFKSTSDVTQVTGIGSGTYEKIRDLVTVNTCP